MSDASLQLRRVAVNSYKDVRPVLRMTLNQLEQPFIKKLEEMAGIDREKLFYIAALFVMFFLLFGPGNALLCTLIGVAYPAYQSLLAICNQSKTDDTQWLIYWCSFALFSQFDFIVSSFANFFPLYLLLKTIMLLYLALPQTCGAHNLYVMYVDPLVDSIAIAQGYDNQSSNFVDEIITKLKRSSIYRFTEEISEQDLRQLCNAAMDVFRQQPTLVRIQPPVVVVGDIHGQFSDLQRIFKTHGYPPQQQYLFLGDYVGRGPQSLETIVLLFCYKVKYPANFILLRGSQECSNTNKAYGFREEIYRCYARTDAAQLFELFNQTFAWMPFVGLIGNRILCMHGGISDKITSLEQLCNLSRPHNKPPLRTLEIDLLWADPMRGVRGVIPNTTGAGIIFGEQLTERICKLLGVDYIIRAHQLVQNGVEYFAGRLLITVFSASEFGSGTNTGATITIAEDLSHTVTRFPPV